MAAHGRKYTSTCEEYTTEITPANSAARSGEHQWESSSLPHKKQVYDALRHLSRLPSGCLASCLEEKIVTNPEIKGRADEGSKNCR